MTEMLAGIRNPILSGVGTAPLRTAAQSAVETPIRGLRLVSADDHWEVTEDIFFKNLPEHLKPVAPRVWFNKVWWTTPAAASEIGGIPSEISDYTMTLVENLANVRGYSRESRAADIEAEGARASIVFPNTILSMLHHPNLELREEVFKIYNRYIAEESAFKDFHGVGIFPNWWESEKAAAQIAEISGLGLKTFMMPTLPRLPDGRVFNFADPHFDRFWTALEASGLPLCFHVGESFQSESTRGILGASLHHLAPFRQPLGQMIFGGVFDRHPGLQVVFAEGGVSWVAPFLQDAELLYDTYSQVIEPIAKRPSDYWRQNCFATFQTDLLGITRLLDIIGADRIMWGADYPHTEGTFGYTRQSVRQITDNTTEEQARLILGETAIAVFRLDR